MSEQRWLALCDALGIQRNRDEFTALQSAYREHHRAYHTLQHLHECLNHLGWVRTEKDYADLELVEAALWYHDAVYLPKARDNEAKSAQWAYTFFDKSGLSYLKCQHIYDLVMATCHDAKPVERTQQIVVDIDLAILGATPERFAQYERQVRKEYWFVPWSRYRDKRGAVLQNFFSMSSIYSTDLFRSRFERQARVNLKKAIARLKNTVIR